MTRERPSRGEWLAALAIALAGLVLRVTAILQYEAAHPQAERPVIDEQSYDGWAREIAAGDWLGTEVFFQEPLYSYWLGGVYALTGGDRGAARMLHAALGALTVMLVWALARRTVGRGAALIGALAMALHRPAIHLTCLLLKENLFLPVLAGLAALILATRGAETRRARWLWFGAGVLGGLGALLRGNLLVMLPVLALWPIGRAKLERSGLRAALAPALCFALGAFLCLAPVALRNHAVGGVLALTTSGTGTNLYGGNNEQNPYGLAKEFSWVRGIPQFEADDWRHEAERRLGRELAPTEVSSYWMGEVGRSVRRDPGLHLSILWNKLRLTLGPYEVPDNHAIDWDARYVPLLRAPLPGFALWGWLGLGGLFLAIGSVAARRLHPARSVDGPAAVELALLAGLYLGTVVLTVTSDRIRLGLVPLLLAFAGHAPMALALGIGARAGGRAGAAVLALALAAPIAWVHALPADARAQDLDERDFNHAVHLLADDAGLDEADRIARALDARFPDSSRLAILLAEIEFRRARPLLAAGPGSPEDFRRGLELADGALERLKPIVRGDGVPPRERHRAQKLAGLILWTAGKPEAAERRLREALAFDPEDRDARWWLANALFAQARVTEGDERARRVAECERILLELRAEQTSPQVEGALAELHALR